MARYSVKTTGTLSTSTAIGGVAQSGAGSPRRLRIYDIIIGSAATPTDAAVEWTFMRWTTTGSGYSSVVPNPLEEADAAALCRGIQGGTTDGTGSTVVLTVPLHHRATFRWIAAPGGEIVVAASTANGVASETPVISSGTPTAAVHYHFEE